MLDPERIRAVETGACPHTAIRDDVTANLLAVEDLERDFAPLDVVLVESGGDNLTATFSPALVDAQIFVLDVAGGGDVARKGGPGIGRADLLVVNKTDLAPYVGVDVAADGRRRAAARDGRAVLALSPHRPRVGRRAARLGARRPRRSPRRRPTCRRTPARWHRTSTMVMSGVMPTRTDRGLRCRFDGSLDLAAGLLAPRLLSRGPDTAEVALVATGATLLGGDRVDADLSVGAGRTLRVRDTSATIAYHGRGRPAAVDARVRVGPGALLVWDAQPLVLATGAVIERTLGVEVEAGGGAAAGHARARPHGREEGGVLHCRTAATYDGRPALVETLTLDAGRAAVGVLGDHRVMDAALAIGARPSADPAATTFDLAEPGRLVRWLGSATHTSPVGRTWAAWARG